MKEEKEKEFKEIFEEKVIFQNLFDKFGVTSIILTIICNKDTID